MLKHTFAKHTLAMTAAGALLLSSAYAQSTKPSMEKNQDKKMIETIAPINADKTDAKGGFVLNETMNDWRSSKLIGADVFGAENTKIGDINDVLIDNSGSVSAAVIGVGGFLGVGEKDVAVPFAALTISRNGKDDGIEKVSVNYSKDELLKAPKFSYSKSSKDQAATGSSSYDTVKSKMNEMVKDAKSSMRSMTKDDTAIK